MLFLLFCLELSDLLQNGGELAVVDFDAVVQVEFDALEGQGINELFLPEVDVGQVFFELGIAFAGFGLFGLGARCGIDGGGKTAQFLLELGAVGAQVVVQELADQVLGVTVQVQKGAEGT